MPESAAVAGPAGTGLQLEVEFLDEHRHLELGEDLTFGRSADLVVDDNPFLHRVVGRFASREGVWWLQNHCRRHFVDVEDTAGTRVSIAPGGQFSLTPRRAAVRFSGGPTNYELTCELSGWVGAMALDGTPPATATVNFGVVPLSENQHLLLVALCAQRLAGVDEVPSSQVAALSLGWTITKFNRQLDHVCIKLRRAGVRGLCGDQSSRALDRRGALVEHALANGLVTEGDLGLVWRSS